jgi:GTP-binding protein YchF
MSLNCGIVGLPNVGKSTLFNAITNTTNAQAANYPFCTIEPNSGLVAVYDARLQKIAAIMSSEKIIPNVIEVTDIAGLVKGASKGEGLGNQFLGNIKQVDAILHVVRCFENPDVIHVNNKIDPLDDISTIQTELLLADISFLEKRISNLEKKAKNQKDLKPELDVASMMLAKMNQGQMAKSIDLDSEQKQIVDLFQLITAKPVIFICNTDEASVTSGNNFTLQVQKYAQENASESIILCAQIEAELSGMSDDEKNEMLKDLGIDSSGLEKVAKAGFDCLSWVTFFTAGPKEARAWSLKKGSTAPNAAGVIHTDFEKGFIKAETIAYKDFVEFNGEAGAKTAGKLRLEGKEYIVVDGDVMHFKFNV